MTLVAIEEAIRALVEHFSGKTVPGWTSLMVVLCLSNAALMIAVGISASMSGRIYEEGKGRPLYIVADAWNLTQRENREGSEGLRQKDAGDDEISLPPLTILNQDLYK